MAPQSPYRSIERPYGAVELVEPERGVAVLSCSVQVGGTREIVHFGRIPHALSVFARTA
jgi:hypothetical protein